MIDLVTYVYLIGFLNYHGLLSVHLNEYARESVYQEELVNAKFREIFAGENWNTKRNP